MVEREISLKAPIKRSSQVGKIVAFLQILMKERFEHVFH